MEPPLSLNGLMKCQCLSHTGPELNLHHFYQIPPTACTIQERCVCVSSCHIWIKQYHMNRSAVVNISTALIFLCLCVASYMVCVWLWKAEGLHVYGKRDCEWERPRRRLPSRWGEWPLLTDTWLRDGPSHYWTIHCNCNTEIHQSCLCFMLLLMPTI